MPWVIEVWTLISLLSNSLMFLLVSILIFFFCFGENEVRTIAVCFLLCNSLVSLNFWVEIMAWVVDFGLSYGLWLVLCFSSFSFGRDDVRTQLFASSFLFSLYFLNFLSFAFLNFLLKLCLKLLISLMSNYLLLFLFLFGGDDGDYRAVCFHSLNSFVSLKFLVKIMLELFNFGMNCGRVILFFFFFIFSVGMTWGRQNSFFLFSVVVDYLGMYLSVSLFYYCCCIIWIFICWENGWLIFHWTGVWFGNILCIC